MQEGTAQEGVQQQQQQLAWPCLNHNSRSSQPRLCQVTRHSSATTHCMQQLQVAVVVAVAQQVLVVWLLVRSVCR